MDYCVVYDNVLIGDNTVIGPYSIIGERFGDYYKDSGNYDPPQTHIGKDSIIRSHSVIYSGCELGDGFRSGHSSIVREFSRFGKGCLFGSFCQTDEKVVVGDYVRCHSRVFLTGGIEIGDYSCLYPGVASTDVKYPPYRQNVKPPKVGRKVIIGAGTLLLPGVRIGDEAFIGAGSLVSQDIPERGVAFGRPAKIQKNVTELKVPGLNLTEPFPFDETMIEQ